jgi:Kef-type K+ transport system membrane component KefB
MEASLAIALGLVVAAGLALESGLSSAILEVLAGMALALLLPAVAGESARPDWLVFLANLGMLALMFMAGFEVQTERLRAEWRACLGVGVASLAGPFLGVAAVAYWGFGLSPLAAALVAIGLSTTSLALVYQSLKEMDLIQAQAGQTLLGAASVADLLSMVGLAILLGDAGWGTAVFLLAVVTTLIGLPRVGAWVFQRYRGAVVEPEVRFLLVLMVAMGFMAEHVGGIHPTVVAFAVGVALSGVVEAHEHVKQKLRGLVFGFFAPVFFIEAGTRLDPRFLDPTALGLAVVLVAIAFTLKFLATASAVRRLAGSEGWLAGVLFNHRLTFGIVAASVGLNTGVLSETLYAVMLSAILGSSVLVAILLRTVGGRVRPWSTRAAERARTAGPRLGGGTAE